MAWHKNLLWFKRNMLILKIKFWLKKPVGS